MLRASMIATAVNSRVSTQLVMNEWIGINATFAQIIRWKRKPIWLPQAKSKLFKVPPRLRLPQEEAVEILRLYNNYRTNRKSIRGYLEQLMQASQVQFDEVSLKNAEEEDYANCSKINDEWNKELAKRREIRLAKEKENRIQETLKIFNEKKQLNEKIMEEIEGKVKRARMEAKTFITRENIDRAIEEALADVVDYNAAIDKEGRLYGKSVDNKQQASV
ncbi:probable 28S ribosomal protein S26, mitochondrial [Fopius arisanus]|uniref:Small ribosomal subunit protein mS26 n=1 Tax=Fopius arisanus TaxID=64838 RepID=A0A9R1TTX3_9HYME|nr:PREDICTED: probable 28S ribosomal protein S26, mitochondrial [Fopius arisanus]XP_011296783.1 PREDICTED: probable 28S ribosomal protein S26, mitochondrial [Fopius arisanus]XP_011296784.1 PREDICTED: probable 28S ribosomal protein S26, mitochondrial [Fopius arisanus]